ncbi:acyltransferase family protein [Hymenobacter radiodurans]|uniref:acyltransferase family protein n=1 Tax=Hymenobacter radiodurans TaxID=2496028 RepID=UPI001058411A|nr:hypothetical protein [Hymenobacter radiodurans]
MFLFAGGLRLKPRHAVLLAAVLVVILTTAYRYYSYLEAPPQTLEQWDSNFRKVVALRLDNLMYGVIAAWWAHYHAESWLHLKGVKFVVGFVALYLLSDVTALGDIGLFASVYYFIIPALATVLLMPLLSQWQYASGWWARAVTHISLISYSMYLLHATIINQNILVQLVPTLPVPQAVRNMIGLLLFWGLTILLSTLMYKYFEVPVMSLRNKVKPPSRK